MPEPSSINIQQENFNCLALIPECRSVAAGSGGIGGQRVGVQHLLSQHQILFTVLPHDQNRNTEHQKNPGIQQEYKMTLNAPWCILIEPILIAQNGASH